MVSFTPENRNPEKVKELVKAVELYHLLSRICLMKCQIMKFLGDTANCEKWSHLHFWIVHDIQWHFRMMEQITEVNFEGKNQR